MSSSRQPLLDGSPSTSYKATTEGATLLESTTDSNANTNTRGPAPPLPVIPERLKKHPQKKSNKNNNHNNKSRTASLRSKHGNGRRSGAVSELSEAASQNNPHDSGRFSQTTASTYTTNQTDGLEPDMDDIFGGDSYTTVEFESESFDVPEKSRSHLNLLPAVKQFAIRNGYEVDQNDLEMTVRAFVIGGLFALLNAAVNMFFAFRYAGGLAQYWVILVSYPLAKATERLPKGLMNPGGSGGGEIEIV